MPRHGAGARDRRQHVGVSVALVRQMALADLGAGHPRRRTASTRSACGTPAARPTPARAPRVPSRSGRRASPGVQQGHAAPSIRGGPAGRRMTTPLTVHLPVQPRHPRAEFTPAKRGAKPPIEPPLDPRQDQTCSSCGGRGSACARRLSRCRSTPPLLARHVTATRVAGWCPSRGAPIPATGSETLVPMRNTRCPTICSRSRQAAGPLWFGNRRAATAHRLRRGDGAASRASGKNARAAATSTTRTAPGHHVAVRDGRRVRSRARRGWGAEPLRARGRLRRNGESLEGCVAREIKEGGRRRRERHPLRRQPELAVPEPGDDRLRPPTPAATSSSTRSWEDARWFPLRRAASLPTPHSISRLHHRPLRPAVILDARPTLFSCHRPPTTGSSPSRRSLRPLQSRDHL